MTRNEEIRLELHFSKIQSASKRKKIIDFWKFIDSQNDLVPYKPERENEASNIQAFMSDSKSDEDSVEFDQIWYKELNMFHKFGLDKTALATKDIHSKIFFKEEKLSDHNLADSVEQSYKELNLDMEKFNWRIRNQGKAKNVYDFPEQYRWLGTDRTIF